MRNVTLEWTIKGLENGYLVQSLGIRNEKFFDNLEDAKNHVKKVIDAECKMEWEDEEDEE